MGNNDALWDHLMLVGQCVCGGGVEDNDREDQVVLTQRNTAIRWACMNLQRDSFFFINKY